jgi:hypothetical protein
MIFPQIMMIAKRNCALSLISSYDRSSWLDLISLRASSLRYGLVQITVEESRVAEIEKDRKVRFHPSIQMPTKNLEA